jgi:hypothetical protein
MSHDCEFITGVEADSNGLPVMIYCEAPAVNFKDRWLCPEHYKQATKSKGGYIYRQGVQPESGIIRVVKPKRIKMP